MSHTFLLVSTGAGIGLSTVSLGLVRALDRLGIRTGFCKPIAQQHANDDNDSVERSTALIRRVTNLTPPTPISTKRAAILLGSGDADLLMEEVVSLYRDSAKNADAIVVEGLVDDGHTGYASRINSAIARALDAEVILVTEPSDNIEQSIGIAADSFGGRADGALVGIILNKVHAPTEGQGAIQTDLLQSPTHSNGILDTLLARIADTPFHLIGAIPWQPSLIAPRTADIAHYLGANLLNAGNMQQRRVHHIELCARTLANIESVYHAHTLLIFPGDRNDVFIAACMSALNGVELAGIVLTGGLRPSPSVMQLCAKALASGVPVMEVTSSSFQTVSQIAHMPSETAADDGDLIDAAMEHVADHLDTSWLQTQCAISRQPRLSPAAFRYQLIQQAQQTPQTILLPEGNEPRTVMAAHKSQQRGIVKPVLLGSPATIAQVAQAQGITLAPELTIIDPTTVREALVAPMVALRRHKGLNEEMARDQLQDNVVLATMMLATGQGDGLVSGATHTTANTVRPAFQLIGINDRAQLVSSIFFMCLPDQVVVYGDCAINPDPNAEQLADIAIQSADSAAAFGIEPRVAMISYSTGDSGSGSDVDKVRQATKLAQARRPDLLIDGPMQYDAASIASVGKSKAPTSTVAGRATVFIFPDLNTGNTTYKAVQRSAHLISIGPMLQGLKKPVNDLSRGASVEDILYTIALTAIQAGQNQD
ncbi:MAG: phosphate acetyltransferase [Mariprofundales bacterium]|nr:phosphate acetyltransferase [Mariprofundales bacterium]